MFPKKIFFKNKVFFFIISLILLIFISSRLLLFPVHFGHGDDAAIGHIIWIFNSYNSLELKSKFPHTISLNFLLLEHHSS